MNRTALIFSIRKDVRNGFKCDEILIAADLYVDAIYRKRSWGGEIQNVSVLVAIGVSQDGYREILALRKE